MLLDNPVTAGVVVAPLSLLPPEEDTAACPVYPGNQIQETILAVVKLQQRIRLSRNPVDIPWDLPRSFTYGFAWSPVLVEPGRPNTQGLYGAVGEPARF